MSISDTLMWRYYELLSFRDETEIARDKAAAAAGRNPRDIKAALAHEIVVRFHGLAAAADAREEFEARFRQGVLPDDMPEFILRAEGAGGLSILYALKQAALTASTSEAIRMIRQGGVKADGARVSDKELLLPTGAAVVLQVGKRKFARVKIEA
ncbi:MAG: tyrosine--tRNA ligase, partial [Zoogloeaceae bacterium]|jgi:tyrosyl-tRNA synthetase|nr:tyrosine--tRNA ligase [Zoogloeaceae bacterium]